jgi:hypothetical protein
VPNQLEVLLAGNPRLILRISWAPAKNYRRDFDEFHS